MNFLKNNSYDIVRFFINQIGITIFSLVLYTSCGFVEDESVRTSLQLAVSIGATLFYFALLYYAAWECGAKDKVRVDSGRQKNNPFKGALMSLFANSLNIILAVAAVICIPLSLGNAAGILSVVIRFVSAMFIGIANVFSSLAEGITSDVLGLVAFIIMYLVTVAVTGFGYFMGVNNYRITSIFSNNSRAERG